MSILMQILWTTQLIFTSVASTVASNLHTFINQTVHSGELEFYWSFEVVHTTYYIYKYLLWCIFRRILFRRIYLFKYVLTLWLLFRGEMGNPTLIDEIPLRSYSWFSIWSPGIPLSSPQTLVATLWGWLQSHEFVITNTLFVLRLMM